MRGLRVLVAVLTVALAGCSGEPPSALETPSSGSGAGASGSGGPGSGAGGPGSTGSGPGSAEARSFFEDNVSPLLDDGAGSLCALCHAAQFNTYPGSPHFMGAAPATYYETIVGNPIYVNAAPGNSKLITQGLHEGPAFTQAQAATVTEWLQMEAEVRFGVGSVGGDGGTPINATGEQKLMEFGDCMTLEVWRNNGMHEVANQPNSAKNNCFGCHDDGLSGNYQSLPSDEAEVADDFEHMRYPTPLTKLVTYEIDATTGQFSKLVQAYRWHDKGKAPTLHPKYILDPIYEASIDAWFAETLAACNMAGGGGAGGGP